MESGGCIRQLQRNQQPLCRGQFTGVVNLVLREPFTQ